MMFEMQEVRLASVAQFFVGPLGSFSALLAGHKAVVWVGEYGISRFVLRTERASR